MKNYIFKLAFSIILIPIWGLGLLAVSTSNTLTVFSMIFLSFIFQNEILRRSNGAKRWAMMVGPSFYFFFLLYINMFVNPQEEFYFNPVIWAYITYLIAFLFYKSSRRVLYISLSLTTALYSLVIYPITTYYYPFFEKSTSTTTSIRLGYNLSEFSFLDTSGQSIRLESQHFILLETWNETCPPCLKSIRNLQDTLGKIIGIENYYLYQQRGKSKLTTDSILNFSLITKKDRILIDPQNALFDSLSLQAFPYFLLFNPNGELVSSRKGYAKELETDILSWLTENTN